MLYLREQCGSEWCGLEFLYLPINGSIWYKKSILVKDEWTAYYSRQLAWLFTASITMMSLRKLRKDGKLHFILFWILRNYFLPLYPNCHNRYLQVDLALCPDYSRYQTLFTQFSTLRPAVDSIDSALGARCFDRARPTISKSYYNNFGRQRASYPASSASFCGRCN